MSCTLSAVPDILSSMKTFSHTMAHRQEHLCHITSLLAFIVVDFLLSLGTIALSLRFDQAGASVSYF